MKDVRLKHIISNTRLNVSIMGDTVKQLLARSRYLLFKSPEKWTKSQKQRADILLSQFDDIKQFYYLALQLGIIYSLKISHDAARLKLA